MRWFRRKPKQQAAPSFPEKIPPDGIVVGDSYVTGIGQIILSIHQPDQCEGRPCVIHAPSDHSLRSFPTNWRYGGAFDIKPPHMERTCPHGIGHPDPDDLAYLESIGETGCGVHGCDGCCRDGVWPEKLGW